MNILVFASFFTYAFAYPYPPAGGSSYGPPRQEPCPEGKLRDSHGVCTEPDVTRDVFVYAPPQIAPTYYSPPPAPKPKLNYNVVFVRTPQQAKGPEPMVVPPPQQKTIVYVLTKNDQHEQKVIEMPPPDDTPSVYYVNYNDGENPTLLGDIRLEDVLKSQGKHGEVLSGGSAYGPPPVPNTYAPPPPKKGYY